jgi:hypothetical protein
MCGAISRERIGFPIVTVTSWTPDDGFVCCGSALLGTKRIIRVAGNFV